MARNSPKNNEIDLPLDSCNYRCDWAFLAITGQELAFPPSLASFFPVGA